MESYKGSYNGEMKLYNNHKKRFEKWGLILMAIVVSVMVFNIRENRGAGRMPASLGNVQQENSK